MVTPWNGAGCLHRHPSLPVRDHPRPQEPELTAPLPPLRLRALEAITAAEPHARKLLIGPDVNWGRELLVALARRTGGWIGWEACTLRSLAEELAFVDLGARGARPAGDVEIATLVDQALDGAIAAHEVSPGFAELAGGIGFRTAVRTAVNELRVAGVEPVRLRRAVPDGSPARDLVPVLERFTQLLHANGLADPAELFRLALAAFEREAPFVLGDVVVLAPDLRATGLPGRLAARMLDAGARMLPDEPVFGSTPPDGTLAALVASAGASAPVELTPAASPLAWLTDPSRLPPADAAGLASDAVTVDLFHAATPTDEIREVLRRTLADGLRLDDVEIVTTDPDTYGVALDAVCQHLGLAHTSLRGIPLGRTRIGRALERWLDWLGDGLPADVIREALEAGDLGIVASSASSASSAPHHLARLFRKLAIGWGRARYDAAVARLRSPDFAEDLPRRDGEDEERRQERIADRRREAARLADLLERLLAVTPAVPERGSDVPVSATAAELARATLGWLELVPIHGHAEQQAAARLRSRLDELAKTPAARTGFGSALAQLRDALADLRAWTSPVSKPWSSGGGMPHLTDVVHAGTTGRPRVFVVGLDADRAAGPRVQDPILNDAVRQALGPDLPTTAERRAEQAYQIARALAGLRGRVTLSYAVAGDLGDRAVGPAHVLLQALRLLCRNPALTYEDLRKQLGAPACPVPAALEQALDAREAWLAALAAGPLLLDGTEQVRDAHPLLDGGLAAEAARTGETPCRYHGVLPDAAGLFDPRKTGRPISPTSLELLGRCPLAWFYHYGVDLRPPDDPEYDAEAWLGPQELGSLLHELYEVFCREYQGRRAELEDPAAEVRILELAESLLARWRERVPPPSEAVFLTERDQVRSAALAFLAHERDAAADRATGEWIGFEVEFSREEPAIVRLRDGELRVTGKIDRVDRLPDGSLVVIDYKTGSPWSYRQRPKEGPFKGGRRLQAAAYAAAAAARFGAAVARFEYRFPTAKGQNEVVRYGPDAIARAAPIVESLLSHVANGHFVPTNDAGDCKYCDYRPICRVRDDGHGASCDRAEWAAARSEAEVYASMVSRRTPEGGT